MIGAPVSFDHVGVSQRMVEVAVAREQESSLPCRWQRVLDARHRRARRQPYGPCVQANMSAGKPAGAKKNGGPGTRVM